MQRFIAALWALCLALTLAACGGGGGGDGGGSAAPALSFSPSTAAANFQSGSPVSVSLRATVANPSVLSGVVYVYVIDTRQVLTGSVNITQLDGSSFSVALHPSPTLTYGRYQGRFEVRLCKDANCAAQYPGSPVSLPYDFNVTALPLQAVATSSTRATMHWAGAAPASVGVAVGATDLTWTATTSASWLRFSGASGTGNGSFTASYVVDGLAVGSYSDKVTLRSNDGQSVDIPFTLDVLPTRLLASEWGVGLTSSPTGTVLGRTLKISGNSGDSLSWTAASDAAWLSVTGSGSTGGASTLTLAADPASLPSGVISYAKVTVSSGTAGIEPAVIRVALWKDAIGLAATTKLSLDYSSIVADKIRPYVYATKGGTSVDIFHAYSAQKIGSISGVGSALGQMAVSPDGSSLYVLDTSARSMAVIDLSTTSKTATWSLDHDVTLSTSLLAIRPNGVEVVLVGDGTAYTNGRSLGATAIYGSIAASGDGRQVYTQNRGISPATVAAFDVDYSEASGGVLKVTARATGWNINNSSNGQDIAVSADGSQLYVASGAPYRCSWVDPSNLSFIASLPGGDAYPDNIEITSDGRAICGISGWYSAADFWVHSSSGALLQSFKIAGYARALKPGQMVVTPDGFVVVTLTDDPLIAFVPIGP